MSPELLLPWLVAGLVVALLTAAVLYTRLLSQNERLDQADAIHAKTVEKLQDELEDARDSLGLAERRVETWLAEKTEAETKLATALQRVDEVRVERDLAVRQRDVEIDKRQHAEREAALLALQRDEMKTRMTDWQKQQEEAVTAAKAAVLASASELSNKLLADHKRESDEAKKDSEERVKKTTEDLLRHMTDLTQTVATLCAQVSDTRSTMETVWKALSSPGGAGVYAEIGLENTLKSFGLEKGRDFVVQQQVDGRGLRPDAVVMMPGDTVIVIDSKASKHILDVAEKEGTDEEEIAYRKLAQTMNQHLKSLTGKNYTEEILASYRAVGRGGDIKRIMTIMYLPNEGAVDKIDRADPQFIRKATASEIAIAGPAALACLMGFARVEIDYGKQVENHDRIVKKTQALLDTISIVVDHTVSVGRGIRTAADSYVKLTGSINQRLLPRARGLIATGVRPARHKGVPAGVPMFQLVQLESGDVIDGEAEPLEAEALLDSDASPVDEKG